MDNSKLNREFWENRRVFVTGGTGLVGGWLISQLLEFGADVVCLVRDWVPNCELALAGNLERVNVVRGEICDQELLERALNEYEVDTVIHLAAQTIVGIANRNPVSTFDSNIRGTWILLEACRRSPLVKQIILASSDKAYGEPESLPYSEQTPLAGRHPYDVSKSCADLIATTYANTYDLPVVITRCGNFFGGGDLNWNRIVPGTIRSVVMGKPPVIRSDGKYIRDYFHVEDGASAYMLLAQYLSENNDIRGEAFNFSDESRVTVVEIVEMILRLMNSELKPVVLNEASNEIREQYLSAEKAKSVLGWTPIYDLETGLKKTIDWYMNFFKTNGMDAN